MHARLETASQHQSESVFEQICKFAKAEDHDGMNALIGQGHSIHLQKGMDTPVMFLAKQNNVLAVNFLINHFNADIFHAVCGYAYAELHTKLDHTGEFFAHYQPIMSPEMLNFANIIGYACGLRMYSENNVFNFDEKPSSLHMTEAIKQYVAYFLSELAPVAGYGYFFKEVFGVATACAYLGMKNELDWLTQHAIRGEEPLEFGIATGYLCAGHMDEVEIIMANNQKVQIDMCSHFIVTRQYEKLIAPINNNNSRENVLLAYFNVDTREGCRGIFWNDEIAILRMLASISDDNGRKAAADYLTNLYVRNCKEHSRINFTKRLPEANKLSDIMRKYQINFDSAYALTQKNARLWLLEGKQLTSTRPLAVGAETVLPRLPQEVYQHISSYVLGVPAQSVKGLRIAVNRQLFTDLAATHSRNYANRLFTRKEEYLEKLADAEEKCKARI